MITMTNASNATDRYKEQLNALIMDTFGFTFEKWHDKNLWNDDYERYSIIENDIMLSNVSAYKMKMLVNGRQCEYLQLGSVATREEHRGKGLSRKIMEHIFSKYPDKPIFLNGDNDALNFYLKLGFKPFAYKQPYIDCSLQKGKGMIKLDVTEPKIDGYLKGRTQYSQILDCKNQYAINWFYLILMFGDNIYEIPELDIMLIAKQQDDILTIYDIAAKKPVSFEQIKPYLDFEQVSKIQFGFNPDWLQIDYLMEDYVEEDSTPLIKGSFNLERDYIIPRLIIT